MLVTKAGARPLTDVGTADHDIVVSGDRAIVQEADASYLVRLDGTAPLVTSIPHSDGGERKVFATGAGFLVFDTTYGSGPSPDGSTRALIVDKDATATAIALGAYVRPTVAWAGAERAWIVADHPDDSADVLALDLVGKQISTTLPFPFCDRQAMQTKGSCFP
jgi:hypothetical protein